MVDFPQVHFYSESADETDAAAGLAGFLEELRVSEPYVVCSRFGETLASAITGPRAPEREAGVKPDQSWAARLGSEAHRSGVDAVVAVGGGRTLDIAKLVAARAGVMLVTVPTQLAHDGICSPVAVVPNETGRTESLGAVTPRAVYLSLPTIVNAPIESVSAGIGDILANPLALRDWALAAQHGLEEVDQRAWDLSVESFEAIEPTLDTDVGMSANDIGFYRRLADSLILSGYAMIVAGSSRPASGGEHEFSHALDELHGGLALHGAQVALGCVVSVALYGEDHGAFRGRLRRLGLPDDPQKLGLTEDQTVEVLLRAPQTRPGRFTILEEVDLSEQDARDLVRKVWFS